MQKDENLYHGFKIYNKVSRKKSVCRRHRPRLYPRSLCFLSLDTSALYHDFFLITLTPYFSVPKPSRRN